MVLRTAEDIAVTNNLRLKDMWNKREGSCWMEFSFWLKKEFFNIV